MIKGKNKFTGQERAGHKPICCTKCSMPGGIKGTQPLRKIAKGQEITYDHQIRCPMQGSYPPSKIVTSANVVRPSLEEIARIQATKSPDDRMA